MHVTNINVLFSCICYLNPIVYNYKLLQVISFAYLLVYSEFQSLSSLFIYAKMYFVIQ